VRAAPQQQQQQRQQQQQQQQPGLPPRPPARELVDDEGPESSALVIDAQGVPVDAAPPKIPSIRDSGNLATPAVPSSKPNGKSRRRANAVSAQIEADEVPASLPVAPAQQRAREGTFYNLPPLPQIAPSQLGAAASLVSLSARTIGAANLPAPEQLSQPYSAQQQYAGPLRLPGLSGEDDFAAGESRPLLERTPEGEYSTLPDSVLDGGVDDDDLVIDLNPVETITVLPQQAAAAPTVANLPERFPLRSRANTQTSAMAATMASMASNASRNAVPADADYDVIAASSTAICPRAPLAESEEWARDSNENDTVTGDDDDDDERVEYDDIVIAQHDYVALNASELSFNAGDQIHVLERDKSGWWRGMVLGRADMQIGLFANTYVEELVSIDVDTDSLRMLNAAIDKGTLELAAMAEAAIVAATSKEAKPVAVESAKPVAVESAPKARPVAAPMSAIVRESQKLTLSADDYASVEIVVASHAYVAKKPKEISFAKGDRLVVERKVQEKGWWSGFVVGKPERRGFFPSTFIKAPKAAAAAAAAAAAPVTTRPRAPTMEYIDVGEPMMAVHDYEAEGSNELTVRRYDILDVHKKNHKTGWFKGKLRGTGKVGWVPGALLRNFSDAAPV
jgi:hypothetical protein